MPQINERDWQQVRESRTRNTLVHLDRNILQGIPSVINLGCGDPFRDPEATSYIQSLLPANEKLPLVHSLKRNGGGAILAPNSPLVKPGRTADEDLMDDIEDAHVRLGIMHLLLKAHVPCLKLYDRDIDVFTTQSMLVRAKQRLKARFPKLSVIKLLDVDPAPFDQQKVTYKVCYRELMASGLYVPDQGQLAMV